MLQADGVNSLQRQTSLKFTTIVERGLNEQHFVAWAGPRRSGRGQSICFEVRLQSRLAHVPHSSIDDIESAFGEAPGKFRNRQREPVPHREVDLEADYGA